MAEQVNEPLADGPVLVHKRNAGWFGPGDRRVNREGRPRGSKAASAEEVPPADRAPRADRLMLLWVPRQDLGHRLTSDHAPWIINLPADYEIVDSWVDANRDAVAFYIRSKTFPRIARGAPIPEFTPEALPPADRAPCDDRLMLLFVPARNLSPRLISPRGGWMTNLPRGFEYVACRVDSARKGLLFTIRSETFPPITRGAIIPEFVPQFFGEPWR